MRPPQMIAQIKHRTRAERAPSTLLVRHGVNNEGNTPKSPVIYRPSLSHLILEIFRPNPGVFRPNPGVFRPNPGVFRPNLGVFRPNLGVFRTILTHTRG